MNAKKAVPDQTGTFTPTEHRVFNLVGEGMSNRQVGEVLGLAEKTVKNHVTNLLTKMGFRCRAQIVAWVQKTCEHGRPLIKCSACLAVDPVDLQVETVNVMISEHGHRLWVCTEDGTVLRIKCTRLSLDDLRVFGDEEVEGGE